MKLAMAAFLILSSMSSVFAKDVKCVGPKNTFMLFDAEEGQVIANYIEGRKINPGADGEILGAISTDNTVAANVSFDGLIFELAATKTSANISKIVYAGKLVKIKNGVTTVESVVCTATKL